jgi:hypothetical protein
MLYNGMLRGFGDCGEVPSDVESKSDAFWEHLKKISVTARIEKAGHKFSSTMHALSSGIKKIQGIAEDGQGTRLYRGLCKLITSLFSTSFLIFNHLKSPMGNVFNLFSSVLIRWAGCSAIYGEPRPYRDGIHVVDPRLKCRA